MSTQQTFGQLIYSRINAMMAEYVSGGVYSQHLPDNFDRDKPIMLIQHRTTEVEKTLDGDSNDSQKEVNVIIISDSPDTNEQIANLLIYRSGGVIDTEHILDFSYQDDLLDWDEETNMYIQSLNFTAVYNH